jgi:hypothetical protein
VAELVDAAWQFEKGAGESDEEIERYWKLRTAKEKRIAAYENKYGKSSRGDSLGSTEKEFRGEPSRPLEAKSKAPVPEIQSPGGQKPAGLMDSKHRAGNVPSPARPLNLPAPPFASPDSGLSFAPAPTHPAQRSPHLQSPLASLGSLGAALPNAPPVVPACKALVRSLAQFKAAMGYEEDVGDDNFDFV